MLYTSYISNITNIPVHMKKYLVVRKVVPGLFQSLSSAVYCERIMELSPTDGVRENYKESKSWDKFKEEYMNQMNNSTYAIQSIERLVRELDHGEDIVLICYEKEYERCHRSILADILIEKCSTVKTWQEL